MPPRVSDSQRIELFVDRCVHELGFLVTERGFRMTRWPIAICDSYRNVVALRFSGPHSRLSCGFSDRERALGIRVGRRWRFGFDLCWIYEATTGMPYYPPVDQSVYPDQETLNMRVLCTAVQFLKQNAASFAAGDRAFFEPGRNLLIRRLLKR